MSQTTRVKLLSAAEKVLLREGVNMLTVRHIGEVSGLNPTLITYHFGSVARLLAELCELNMGAMREGWRALEDRTATDAMTVDEVLRLWLAPLLAPASSERSGRALVVLDEIASHGDEQLRANINNAMRDVAILVREILAPKLPHLDEAELGRRLRFIAGAALGPPPRGRIDGAWAPSAEEALNSICRFAAQALAA
ncbi:AcrR family transcriptional regulator [Altererythrobacter atlanticus]|uniref:TetR family regulatory protein n=1 Tax=Croceibacterium atlanticum TaxID=1267766 RepID=A0A0F7KL77_9SPHN|nr:TetR family transcriptional regulator [Croceibacterium atlanticum]AKH41313.1 TetR family regulatory protein [Croceibacterium atlanticum]MBB5732831.1 AcrR family transcriptional regulator [Croceibacterium atlanticum]